ncbi:MAG: tRNA (adenosine(37)-N6)-threonylcarbamoyltransferase complex ATPase subunit type 1 TsaE [Saprospiraceae bacterium]
MRNQTFFVEGPESLAVTVDNILKSFPNCKIFLLEGNLGSGKTTLVKYFCQKLNYTGMVNSPTYSIINEYEVESQTIYHMDLYRLKNREEVLDIGIEEYFYSNMYCFIEWPELVKNMIYEPYLTCQIENTGEFSRNIHCWFHSNEN